MTIRAYRDDSDRLCLLLNAPDGPDPPTEFTVLKAGETKTSKGTIRFDDLSAEMVMKRFQDQGTDQLPVDYDHGMLSLVTTPDGSKAAGWFTPAVVGGDLMALNVEWTPKAMQSLKDREYRFFSPALMLSNEEGDDTPRVTRLMNVALTNLPATRDQVPLVASDKGSDRPPEARKQNAMNELLKLLGVKTEAESIAAVMRIQQDLATLLSDLDVSNTAEAIEKINTWRKAATEAVKLAEQVRSLEIEKSETEKSALIKMLHDEGKLSQSLVSWAQQQTIETLKAFGAAAPVNPKHTNHEPPNGEVVALSDSETQVCQQLGMTKAEYIEAKKMKAQDDASELAKREGRVI